jgi:hypothetical protein
LTPSAAPATGRSPSSAPSSSATPSELKPPAAPTIAGTLAFGKKLAISQGAWKPAPVALAFQWLRDGEPIEAATSGSYQLIADDITHHIAVIVTGSRDGYADASLRSAQVGPIMPAALTPATPTISGTAKVGRTLTAKVTPWGPGKVSLAWQWYRGSEPIADATTVTYKLSVADYGHTIKVRVTGTRKDHQTARRDSTPTAKVAAGTLSPTPKPALSGTPKVGEKLTADSGDWGPGTVLLAYQWLRNSGRTDIAIGGATGSRYTATPADADARLRVRVTASRKGYAPATRFSVYSASVAKGELGAPTPVITGRPVVGNHLTADPGAWGPGQVNLVLQWYRDGRAIVRANGTTHLLTARDVRHKLTVRVTGSRTGYISRTVESAATATITSR